MKRQAWPQPDTAGADRATIVVPTTSPLPIARCTRAIVDLGTVREIQIGPVTLRDQTVATLPLDGVSAAHGIPIEGTIGFSLFARYVVEIDYAGRAPRLHEPAAYTLPNGATILPVDLSVRIPIAQVRLSARGRSPVVARLVVDVGTGSIGVILTSPFRRAHDAHFPLDAGIERPIGHGVGGAPRGRIVRLASVNVGNLSFAGRPPPMPNAARGFSASTGPMGPSARRSFRVDRSSSITRTTACCCSRPMCAMRRSSTMAAD